MDAIQGSGRARQIAIGMPREPGEEALEWSSNVERTRAAVEGRWGQLMFDGMWAPKREARNADQQEVPSKAACCRRMV